MRRKICVNIWDKRGIITKLSGDVIIPLFMRFYEKRICFLNLQLHIKGGKIIIRKLKFLI